MGRVTNLGTIELNGDRRTSSIYVESTVGVGKLRRRRQKVIGQIPNITRVVVPNYRKMGSVTCKGCKIGKIDSCYGIITRSCDFMQGL